MSVVLTAERQRARDRAARIRSRVFRTLDGQWRGTDEFTYAGPKRVVRRILKRYVREGVAEHHPCGAWRLADWPSDGYLHTGIRNLAAAKRDIRRRHNRGLPEAPVSRPGARFYVTVRNGRRSIPLLGPYSSHMIALSNVARGRALACARDPFASAYAFGTASTTDTLPGLFGR